MQLGAFSISLAVKDLDASKRFYENFGFSVFAGDASQNWLILKNGDQVIGLLLGKDVSSIAQEIQSAGAHRLRDLVQVPLHGRGVALDQIVIWSGEKNSRLSP